MKTKLHTSSTYSAKRTSETIIWLSAITILFILFSYTNVFADSTKFEEKQYIDDIPFDTEMVVNEMLNSEFYFEDEAYIDDIPFNTARIAANYKFTKATSVLFEPEDETYIDDIPFSTGMVAKRYAYVTAVSIEFQLNDESYIDDIPFDTFAIANSFNNGCNSNLCYSGK